MASIPCALIVLLISLSQDHMGVQGNINSVFSSVGENATLPCSGFYPVIQTGWYYSRFGSRVKLTSYHGRIISDRAGRLSLLSDSSLHITDVTTEDAGHYILEWLPAKRRRRAWMDQMYNGVYLSVLNISSRVTKAEACSDVTIYCHLHAGNESVVDNRDVRLSWVDEGGVELQNTNRLQISRDSPCSTTLTVQLRDPNPVNTQRTWRCQVTAEGKVQTSANYTIRVKASSEICPSPHFLGVHVAVRVATTISLFVAVIIVVLIHWKRSGDPQDTQ
ncbi:uncharacterized protein LOC143109504 isoform X2 [Alosa pseudoharengus]|uniref:uncharacterized protein LOC143109504 isoform X2 n=1 Tax=Alosa pseudoharengus TaxID=34774 RepID=UPI003F88A0E0